MRPGVRIGVDVGTVRVGVARSDASGVLAVPVATLRRGHGDLEQLVALVAEHAAVEVLVGLPLGLSGAEGTAAEAARAYAERLARRIAAGVGPVPVRLVDERLTTSQAHGSLAASGVRGRARREVVDQAAAAIMVQHALDAERTTGEPPGRLLTLPVADAAGGATAGPAGPSAVTGPTGSVPSPEPPGPDPGAA